MRKILIIALVLSAVSSCSPRISPDQTWVGRRWVLTEMKGVPVQLSGTRRDAYLEFFPQDKRFAGNGGCNRISGQYTLEKSRIKLENVISTKMSCNDINFESSFLSLLNDVDRFKMEDNNTTLLLRDGNKVILKFIPGTPERN